MPRKTTKLLAATAVVGLVGLPASQAQVAFHYNGPVETPAQNVARSAHYDWLLEHSPRFRAYRMRKECGPIRFALNLRQDCFRSFDQYEPVAYNR
jgi:hypothetical protein